MGEFRGPGYATTDPVMTFLPVRARPIEQVKALLPLDSRSIDIARPPRTDPVAYELAIPDIGFFIRGADNGYDLCVNGASARFGHVGPAMTHAMLALSAYPNRDLLGEFLKRLLVFVRDENYRIDAAMMECLVELDRCINPRPLLVDNRPDWIEGEVVPPFLESEIES